MILNVYRKISMNPSSLIRNAEYDTNTKELTVRFQNGAVYLYSDVPELVIKKWAGAKSVGKYFNKNIKSFSCEKLV